MMGFTEEAETSLRLKYGLLIKADGFIRSIDSFTMVHGAYGNFVISPYDDTAFCSWYPSCMKGLMRYGSLPETWDQACEGNIEASLIETLKKDNFESFQKILPGLKPFEVLKTSAGVILAEGSKDITHKDSLFHARSEFPIRERSGYFLISTGKYTSAPRNTRLLEQIIEAGPIG